jgi:hypothetical protein
MGIVDSSGWPAGIHAERIWHVSSWKRRVLRCIAANPAVKVVNNHNTGRRGSVCAIVNKLTDDILRYGGKCEANLGGPNP